jgi:hypothetical protein
MERFFLIDINQTVTRRLAIDDVEPMNMSSN